MTRRFWPVKFRIFPLAVFLLLVMFLSVAWRILDPDAKKPNSLLKKIAPKLDKLNIHVVQDWNSKIQVDNRGVIIAPLANWPARNNEQFTTGWIKDLKNGLHAGYVAVRYNTNLRLKDIPLVWNSISKSKRVFISFTRSDDKVAEQLRQILESEGYKVFTYVKDGEISRSYEEIGKIMSTAGEHFVIDSYNSRTSQGVIAEALTHTTYELKYPKVEILAPNYDGKPHLVKYDENKVKFIDAMVTAGIPMMTSVRERKLLFFDPSVRNLGNFYQNVFVKINGKMIEDPQEFSKWTTNILSNGAAVSREIFMQNLPKDAHYCSKELFDNVVLKSEKRKAEFEIRKRSYMQEQKMRELNNEIKRDIISRRRIL